jgi:hypothetical protein
MGPEKSAGVACWRIESFTACWVEPVAGLRCVPLRVLVSASGTSRVLPRCRGIHVQGRYVQRRRAGPLCASDARRRFWPSPASTAADSRTELSTSLQPEMWQFKRSQSSPWRNGSGWCFNTWSTCQSGFTANQKPRWIARVCVEMASRWDWPLMGWTSASPHTWSSGREF